MRNTAATNHSSNKWRPSSIQRFLYIAFFFSLLENLASLGLLIWKIPRSIEAVFLHYNIYFGIDLTGSWYQLLWLPGSGVAILLVNGLIAFSGKSLTTPIKLFIACFTIGLEAMLLVASLLLVLLNG